MCVIVDFARIRIRIRNQDQQISYKIECLLRTVILFPPLYAFEMHSDCKLTYCLPLVNVSEQ